jgi:hypothetical protein
MFGSSRVDSRRDRSPVRTRLTSDRHEVVDAVDGRHAGDGPHGFGEGLPAAPSTLFTSMVSVRSRLTDGVWVWCR